MEKNIIVTCPDGTKAGVTYAKRARGLIKSGRAEYISDCEIRLRNITHALSVTNDTEDKIMSNVINFNARQFRPDETCQSNNNVNERTFITDCTGVSVEAYTVGDWNWNQSQICYDFVPESNADYLFRFAVDGGVCDTFDEKLRLIIMYDNNWDDRQTYVLEADKYRPTFSKSTGTSMLRVYEIPFNSSDASTIRLMFMVMHAQTTFLPAHDNSTYEMLKDYTYADHRRDRAGKASQNRGNNGGWGSNGGWGNMNFGNVGSNMPSMDEIEDCIRSSFEDAYESIATEKNKAILNDVKESIRSSFEDAYQSVSAEYEAAPEGSPEKKALKAARDGLGFAMRKR